MPFEYEALQFIQNLSLARVEGGLYQPWVINATWRDDARELLERHGLYKEIDNAR